MNIVIDIGNTAIKAAAFKGDKLFWTWKSGDKIDLKKFSPARRDLNHSIVSSVIKTNELKQLLQLLKSTSVIRLSHKTPLPFHNLYKTPATLGLDRIASVAGGQKKFPNKNVLIIDAGTCIKYDFINKQGEYKGGSISPGLQMRFKSLHNFTDQLPLIKPERVRTITGNSTEGSILTGVVSGITNEIEGFINIYKKEYNELKVVLTGGDAAFLKRQLKSSIFAAPYLTLEGLNQILNFNIDNQ